MKLAAVVPALFVLISFCGSPVPAPPGSVSGLAFYDANRNGIHDSCDHPLSLATVVATAADGKAETSTSGPDGTFHIDKVDPGQALITLTAPDGEVWHTTTDTAGGTPGAAVEVKDLRDSIGVEIGATSASPMSATQISVSGVIFDDANGNGQVDKDECGIPQAWAYVSGSKTRIGGPLLDSGPSGDGTYFVYGLDAAGTVLPNLPEPGWVAATSGPGDDPCSQGVVPTSWHGTTVYEANIGFKRGTITSSVSGALFDDANSDGLRDDGEAGISNIGLTLEPSVAPCGAWSPGRATTGPDGTFAFHNLQPGSYRVYLSDPAMQARQPVSQIVTLGQPQQQIAVGAADVTANIAATIQPAAYAGLQFFSDANGNGRWDADESPVFNYVYACLSTGATVPDLTGGPDSQTPSQGQCAGNGGGFAQIGPVPEGDYSLIVWDQFGTPPTAPTLTGLHLSASSPVTVDVPLTLEPTPTFHTDPTYRPVSPGVIPSGATTQTMTVCYSDPGWVQRPFEDGYDPAQPFYASWGVDEAAARAVYSVGIYAATPTNTPDTYVWSAIAGLPWREPPGCDPSQTQGWAPTYDLVGLEPISAVDNQSATQITVRFTGHGLYGIMISPQPVPLYRNPDGTINGSPQKAKSVLFVDESNKPIAECDALGACRDVAID